MDAFDLWRLTHRIDAIYFENFTGSLILKVQAKIELVFHISSIQFWSYKSILSINLQDETKRVHKMEIKGFTYKQNAPEKCTRTCYINGNKVSFAKDQRQDFLPVPEDGVFDLTKLHLSHCSLAITKANVTVFVNNEIYQLLERKMEEDRIEKLDKIRESRVRLW